MANGNQRLRPPTYQIRNSFEVHCARDLTRSAECCSASGQLRPNCQLLARSDCAIGMPGNKAHTRQLGQEGRRVTDHPDFYYDFDDRPACGAPSPSPPPSRFIITDWGGTTTPTPNMPTSCCACTAPASRTPRRCRLPI